MIMRHDNARRTVRNGIGEHFARMNQASSERADGDDALGDESIGAVEREADEVFLLFVTNVAQLLGGFFGTIDDWALANFKLSAPELKASHNICCFGWAKTFDTE